MEVVHDYVFGGALRKGGDWAGPECAAAVPKIMHLYEGCAWAFIAALLYFALNVRGVIGSFAMGVKSMDSGRGTGGSSLTSVLLFERVLSVVHFAMFAQLVYWKFNDKAMIMLAQPCHIILFLEGIALLSPNSSTLGTTISVLVLPALTGTLLAMVVPGTSGLSKLEVTCYWLQHIIIQIVPFYLLVRRDFQALRLCSIRTVLVGIWILQVAHWTFYAGVDFMFSVNVEFMLCPTFGMRDTFNAFPAYLFFPSYRTTLTWVVALLAIAVSYSYIFPARILAAVLKPAARVKKVM